MTILWLLCQFCCDFKEEKLIKKSNKEAGLRLANPRSKLCCSTFISCLHLSFPKRSQARRRSRRGRTLTHEAEERTRQTSYFFDVVALSLTIEAAFFW